MMDPIEGKGAWRGLHTWVESHPRRSSVAGKHWEYGNLRQLWSWYNCIIMEHIWNIQLQHRGTYLEYGNPTGRAATPWFAMQHTLAAGSWTGWLSYLAPSHHHHRHHHHHHLCHYLHNGVVCQAWPAHYIERPRSRLHYIGSTPPPTSSSSWLFILIFIFIVSLSLYILVHLTTELFFLQLLFSCDSIS